MLLAGGTDIAPIRVKRARVLTYLNGLVGSGFVFLMKSIVSESRHTASDDRQLPSLITNSRCGFLPAIRHTEILPTSEYSSSSIEVNTKRVPSGDGTGMPQTVVESPVESSTTR